MDNISWAKTVSNWGSCGELPTKKQPEETTVVVKVAPEDFLKSKEEIVAMHQQLKEKTAALYEQKSNKDLYDIIISLESVKKSLELVKY